MKMRLHRKHITVSKNNSSSKSDSFYKITGTSLVELMLVSMITVFGALILFLLLSITKTKSIDSMNENESLFNSFILMKTVSKELKENAKSISYPNWNITNADSHIQYTGIIGYAGNQYSGEIHLENGQVYLKRVYQDGSRTDYIIGANIQSITFSVKDQNNRYLEIDITLKIKNMTYLLRDFITLRS